MSTPSSSSSWRIRRPKWHYPPPPRILHFPRRRRTLTTTNHPAPRADTNLVNHHPPIVVLDHYRRRRERVENGAMFALDEEKWKLEAEMLRAECNLLRMEKEIAVKNLHNTRAVINTTLTSTIHTLLSARMKICNGMNIGMVLDEEIHHLTQKLHKFQNKWEAARNNKSYDKQVSVLQRRVKKIGGSSNEIYLNEFQEKSTAFCDNVVASGKLSEKVPREGNLCSGHCKTIVGRIVEQVRVETEQWSQMQEMLVRVREEMEDLHASRDFWENRAMQSEIQTQPLHNALQEWRQRAVASESKTNELEEKISILNGELESLRKEKNAVDGTKCSPIPPLDTQNVLEKRIVVCTLKQSSKHNEVLRNRERKAYAATRVGVQATKRSPFQDIGNNSSLSTRQNGKVVFPLCYHISSNVTKTR